MRRAMRPLFLLAILGIAGYLLVTYRQRIAFLRSLAPQAPVALPKGISASASEGWHWRKDTGSGPTVELHAKKFRQIEEPSRFELEQIELKIFRKDGETYDRIVSDRAEFDMAQASLYSEGEANITMGVSEDDEPSPNRVVHIKSSGIRFDSKSGKAETDREATFATERGEGKAVGAIYDPATRELKLKSQAQLLWHDPESNAPPMKVEAGEVIYKENESKVLLSPWAKFTRVNMTLEGKGAVVTLDKDAIRLVETTEAKGADRTPGRSLDYTAAELKMSLSQKSEIEKIEAKGNAQLVTTSDQAVTTTRADRVDLDFDASSGESLLRRVLASGKSQVESRPQPRPNVPQGDTKVLRSEVVELKMRVNGREIETMDTQTPGVLEFFPNRAGQHPRRVDGDRFHVEYGAQNQVDSLRVTQAVTRTENPPKQGKLQPPSLTWSRELTALFAPKTGEMTRMEQTGDFRYEEGERKARSERALLDQTSGRITLVQGARVSDATGSTTADQIILDQKTEDFVAQGNVASSRQPDRKGSGSAMLSRDEPFQARAARMNTYERQSLVVYDGNAMLWQAASRIQADRIEIDRKNSQLRANGKVVSQIQDGSNDDKKKNEKAQADKAAADKTKAPPSFTLINAPAMIYHDKERLAHYSGGAFLRRENLDVKADEIRAYLTPEDKPDPKATPKPEAKPGEKPPEKQDGTSLDRAVADGNVAIVKQSKDRTGKGSSGHADYIVKEGKIVLERGASSTDPTFDDSVKGTTRGRQLIYFPEDDRLLVSGVPAQPAASKLRRKH